MYFMQTKQPPKKKTKLELVAFKIDPDTLAMLDELSAYVETAMTAKGDPCGGRSHAIRKAIRFSHMSDREAYLHGRAK